LSLGSLLPCPHIRPAPPNPAPPLYLPQVGTMIEVPRGALRAGDLAKHADFFSFGTNDLTQVWAAFCQLPSRAGRGAAQHGALRRSPACDSCLELAA